MEKENEMNFKKEEILFEKELIELLKKHESKISQNIQVYFMIEISMCWLVNSGATKKRVMEVLEIAYDSSEMEKKNKVGVVENGKGK